MSRNAISLALAAALWVICAYEPAVLVGRALLGALSEAHLLGRLLTQTELADRAAPLGVAIVFIWVMLATFAQTARIACEHDS
jgi:hypothetical protein